jgi:hypothetical protein
MKTRTMLLSAVLLAAAVGCNQNPSQPADSGKPDAPGATPGPGDQSKLDAHVLPAKPAKPISVRDALKSKEGEKVVVSGQVPPVNVKPYNAALAAFVMLAPEDLALEHVKEEMECEDAATCPKCKKLLEQYAVQVEVIDASGAPVGASLEGFRGLKPGSTITVEGEVKRYGKDNKLVRIVATKFYPG